MKTKAKRPEYSDVEKPKYDKNNRPCRNCGCSVTQDYIKGIWKHDGGDDDNPYNCQLAEPFTAKQFKAFHSVAKYECNPHNYKKNKHADCVMCTECADVIHIRDFFTSFNVYWCRSCNMKFTSLEYHKKKYHTHKIGKRTHTSVVDYVDYSDVNPEEKPTIVKEDGKRVWSEDGHGYSTEIDTYDNKVGRVHVTFANYGLISKSKFIDIISNFRDTGGKTWIKDRIGDGCRYYERIKPEYKEQILIFDERTGRVIARYDYDLNLLWMDDKIAKSLKKRLLSGF